MCEMLVGLYVSKEGQHSECERRLDGPAHRELDPQAWRSRKRSKRRVEVEW